MVKVMYYLIVSIIAIVFLSAYLIVKLVSKNKVSDDKILKVFSVILFFGHFCMLFYHYEIDKAVALQGCFPPGMLAFMMFLRWFTTMMVAVALVVPFIKLRTLKILAKYLLPVIAITNLILVNDNLVAMFGYDYDYLGNYRTYGFLLQTGIMISIGIIHVINMIRERDFKLNKKDLINLALVIPALMVAFFPEGGIQVFIGKIDQDTKDFSLAHRISIYANVVYFAIAYFGLRKKSPDVKRAFLVIAGFSAFSQYFYEQRHGLSALPLHLCNTAIILVFLAYVFKNKSLYYFTFFVNVLGSFFAMVLPECNYEVSHIISVHYWYNHIQAFVLPLLGIGLGLFPRPNLKMMFKSIGVFALYFVTVITINAWFNNYGEVDYFFTYGDFFTKKFNFLGPLKENYVAVFYIGSLRFRYYWLMQLMIFGGFILLMFITWIFYDYAFKISDEFSRVMLLKKETNAHLLELKQLMDGRELTEPLEKESQNMIKIEHFTKQYAGSNKPSVDDFNLEIHDGEVFGFLGHNGAGKSTTIKSMVGIQSITSGKIIIDGYDISKQPLEAKLRVGYVSDNHAVYEKLTGREYINYVADLYLVSQEDRDIRIKKYTEMFNLVEAIDREIKGYSHGMKQKLVVIASLIHNPKVWILDEPLTGLDPTSAFQIKECMREHANNGNIVFFSSHVIEVVEKICDKICIIQRGKLVGTYVIKDLKDQGLTLEQLYMKHVAQANYNTSAPAAISEFEKKKKKA